MVLKREVAFVDLNLRQVEIKKIPQKLRELYLGGRGIDMYLLYNLVEPRVDPLGPENVLLVSAGLLTATPAPGPSRTHIGGKSPLTGLVGSTNMGGFFAPELRFSGFDHLVIRGKADRPVYLWICNGDVEIRDASHLWGADCSEAQVLIREELGDEDIKVMSIGVAGENLVRFANVRTGPKNSGGRTGMGAVMGSKNLKAIAVRGSLPIKIENPEGALQYLKELDDLLHSTKLIEFIGEYGTPFVYNITNSTGLLRTRNFEVNQLPDSEEIEAEAIKEYTNGTTACFGCTVHCRHKYVLKEGPWKGKYAEGPEYTTQGAFATEVENRSLHRLMEANYLVNKLGLDTLETGSMISWAIELYEKGLLPKELVGNLNLEWGNMDAILQLTEDIAFRRGLGNILAEGPRGAIKKLGPETAYYNIQIKGMSNLQSDERPTPSLALGIATSTRGADHLRSRPAIDLYHLPVKLLEYVYGRKGMTSDYRDYQGKPWMIFWHECLFALLDAMGICKIQTVFLSPNMPKWEEYSRLLEKVTGMKFSPEQLMEVGERIYNIERLFNIREGVSREDDILPERYFKEPTSLGLDVVRGQMIDREKFERMLDEYYEFHGWDMDGNPTPETLIRLGLDNEPSHLLEPSHSK